MWAFPQQRRACCGYFGHAVCGAHWILLRGCLAQAPWCVSPRPPRRLFAKPRVQQGAAPSSPMSWASCPLVGSARSWGGVSISSPVGKNSTCKCSAGWNKTGQGTVGNSEQKEGEVLLDHHEQSRNARPGMKCHRAESPKCLAMDKIGKTLPQGDLFSPTCH